MRCQSRAESGGHISFSERGRLPMLLLEHSRPRRWSAARQACSRGTAARPQPQPRLKQPRSSSHPLQTTARPRPTTRATARHSLPWAPAANAPIATLLARAQHSPRLLSTSEQYVGPARGEPTRRARHTRTARPPCHPPPQRPADGRPSTPRRERRPAAGSNGGRCAAVIRLAVACTRGSLRSDSAREHKTKRRRIHRAAPHSPPLRSGPPEPLRLEPAAAERGAFFAFGLPHLCPDHIVTMWSERGWGDFCVLYSVHVSQADAARRRRSAAPRAAPRHAGVRRAGAARFDSQPLKLTATGH